MKLILNGEPRHLAGPASVAELLAQMGIDRAKVAVERNLEIVPKSAYDATVLDEGDKIEVVAFIGGGCDDAAGEDPLVVAGRRFSSRLLVGTGKYKDFEETARAIEASGAEIVTVAVRRVNLTDPTQPMLVDYVSPKKYTFLPNTAGCYTAEEAVRTLRLAREAGGWNLVKLEVLGDQTTLYPNMPETLRAAEALIKDGFEVMVYCSDDPIQARMLADLGCVAIMPLGSLIGSGLGILNPTTIQIIKASVSVPVLVDAGVGAASDAAVAMELGCDGVLLNTAIAHARDPIAMARAMKHAVIAGRLSFQAGRMPRKSYADPSSPTTGLIGK
ncbi:sulfur carrier protein ThiS [Phaeospirillum tilakii]|uniref:Thiazole synthase n=1 Tax=Phaeospirillum tilakii TaxID=741673 RepID=A0ABW5CFX6_9PROT